MPLVSSPFFPSLSVRCPEFLKLKMHSTYGPLVALVVRGLTGYCQLNCGTKSSARHRFLSMSCWRGHAVEEEEKPFSHQPSCLQTY
ncbi:hypothetical protein SADUNF_Sadunf05G0102400 [Salix dunnii]|uniref:Uncharacterized protein n=1 Tax=Salix dunnii TaxID=1413687 RepID=A0A835K4K3_9ROSI|nr:hypothetical protein SADUNF_Sadunf05G0102400 [Salix dunnii]